MKGDAGEVEAPAGKPLIATLTVPLNPFSATVDTVKLEPELPGSAVIAAGDTLMPKSGALTVNATVAECASAPDVPLTTTL